MPARLLFLFFVLSVSFSTAFAQPTGEGAASNTAIREFSIAVSDQAIDDLKLRLSLSRIPDQLDNISWEYGTDKPYLLSLLDYWQNNFDWRAQEAMLNGFDQYKTIIDGLDIHFPRVFITRIAIHVQQNPWRILTCPPGPPFFLQNFS
jgi:hypothetical protein